MLQSSRSRSVKTTNKRHAHHAPPPTVHKRNVGISKRGVGRQAVKTIYTPRSTKTAIIGAGPAGLLTARMSQILGYTSPMTIIDRLPPGRPNKLNNKRNHPLLISTQTLDALQLIDPRLYRRLLSLGRMDTLAGYLDWNDSPTHLFAPKEHPSQPFPRWINHLCMPRDAFIQAILTTPISDLSPELKEEIKKVQRGKAAETAIPRSVLPQIGINLAAIHHVETPGGTEEYQKTRLPIVKVVPQSLHEKRKQVQAAKLQAEVDVDQDERFKVPKPFEFNLVIAADGKASDLFGKQYDQANTQRLRPTPNDNIRVHGWCRVDALKDMVGASIAGIPFYTEEQCYDRLSSRIFIRRTEGIRFTSILMDYPPIHLTQGHGYQPKEPTDRADWVYWELTVAKAVWAKMKQLPTPLLPAVNNISYQKLLVGEEAFLSKLTRVSQDNNIVLDGVFMGPGDPLQPQMLLDAIPELNEHPLARSLIKNTPKEGMTVERVMYNPVEQLRGSCFHDHVIYAGDAAASSTNDAFAADTLVLENAVILGLALAANNTTPPEVLARRVSSVVDHAFLGRAQKTQQREVDDDVYYGDPSKIQGFVANFVEKYFPPQSRQERYEGLYRYNPQRAFEIAATEGAKDILERNLQYRHSVQSGFLDGSTRKMDFGDVPVDQIDLTNVHTKSKKGMGYDDGKIAYKSLRQRSKDRE